MQELGREFAGLELRLRYIPDLGLAGRIAALPDFAPRTILTSHRRPLLRVTDDQVRASLAKKSNKSRLNRLSRLGVLSFRRVTDVNELAKLCNPLMGSYDFR